MTEKQPRRPRIDAVINAIKRGDYDDRLRELREAIDGRNKERQQQVLELVEEVFGEGYTVTANRSNPTPREHPRERVFSPAAPESPPEVPAPAESLAEPAGKIQEAEMEIESRGARIGGTPDGPAY